MERAKTLTFMTKSIAIHYLALLTMLIMVNSIHITDSFASESNGHPLVGKIWSVNTSNFVSPNALRSEVLKSQHTIVGETHDNKEHHEIQAKILKWLIQDGQRINPVFEMLSEDQINPIRNLNLTSSDVFFDKVAWETTGWPDRSLYKPIFDIVISEKMQITPAEMQRDSLLKLIKNGKNSLPKNILQSLKLVVLDNNARQLIEKEIIDSHCGMLPKKMVSPMILGQRVRDVVMANSVAQAGSNGPTILFAGSGHGRKDFGVPAYLSKMNPNQRIVSIALIETLNEITTANEYSQIWASDVMPFDYIWFTKRVNRKDPCEELKDHFKNHPA